MAEKLLKVEELAMYVGVSVQTINHWYKWKKSNSSHEFAKLLPKYIQKGEGQVRYWKYSDIYKLIQFKTVIPKGRAGIMATANNKYYKKEK